MNTDTILLFESAIEDIVNHLHFDRESLTLLEATISAKQNITPTELIEIAETIARGEKRIFDAQYSFTLDNVLLESYQSPTLFDVVYPSIKKNIPERVLSYFSEKQAVNIVEQILQTPIDSNDSYLDIRKKIDEMFTSGDLMIPVQGLRNEANPIETVMYGVFAPLLHKNIKLTNIVNDKNKTNLILKDLVSNRESPKDEYFSRIMPRFISNLKAKLYKDN